jgi:SAM-dependent methyltransferase
LASTFDTSDKGSVGITTAEEEVAFGKENNLNIKIGNAERLDPSVGHFEAFWANNLYEHLLSPHAFLMNLKRLSKHDTLLILGVPVVPKIVALMNLRWGEALWLPIMSISLPTPRSLSQSREPAGVLSIPGPLYLRALFWTSL